GCSAAPSSSSWASSAAGKSSSPSRSSASCGTEPPRDTPMIDFDKAGGLVPAVAQDAATGEVLMLAWMNREAFEETVHTRRAVYFSRSRNKLWRKGEESGHVQEVADILLDCDADTVLLKVRQAGGAACHEGYRSCSFRRCQEGQLEVVGERVFAPKAVYKK